jgi:hypothetical protein
MTSTFIGDKRERRMDTGGSHCTEKSDCIDSPVFGDMRALRESIIHNNGKAKKRIPQRTSEAWFEEGEEIVMDRLKFENCIIDEIYAFIKEFRIDPYKFIRPWKKKKKSC